MTDISDSSRFVYSDPNDVIWDRSGKGVPCGPILEAMKSQAGKLEDANVAQRRIMGALEREFAAIHGKRDRLLPRKMMVLKREAVDKGIFMRAMSRKQNVSPGLNWAMVYNYARGAPARIGIIALVRRMGRKF